jgi:hypothetical protein
MVLGSADHPDWIAIKISCNLGDYTLQYERYTVEQHTSEPLRAVMRPGGGCLSIPQLFRHHTVVGH